METPEESNVILNANKTFSFFGYEPNHLGGFDKEEQPINKWVRFSIKAMEAHLSILYKNCVFITGGCPGTEIWAAEEALSLQTHHPEREVKLSIILPTDEISGRSFDGSRVTKRPWPIKSHNRMVEASKKADEAIFLSGGECSKDKIAERDKWVIDRSTGVLLVYNNDGRDGYLSNVLELATSRKCQVCIIDPSTESIYIL